MHHSKTMRTTAALALLLVSMTANAEPQQQRHHLPRHGHLPMLLAHRFGTPPAPHLLVWSLGDGSGGKPARYHLLLRRMRWKPSEPGMSSRWDLSAQATPTAAATRHRSLPGTADAGPLHARERQRSRERHTQPEKALRNETCYRHWALGRRRRRQPSCSEWNLI